MAWTLAGSGLTSSATGGPGGTFTKDPDGAGGNNGVGPEAQTFLASIDFAPFPPSSGALASPRLTGDPALIVTSAPDLNAPPVLARSYGTRDITPPSHLSNPVTVNRAAARIPLTTAGTLR